MTLALRPDPDARKHIGGHPDPSKESAMDDMKKAGREVETDAKKASRNWDGEDLADKVGNAGDEIRKDLGNAGDDLGNAVDNATDKARETDTANR